MHRVREPERGEHLLAAQRGLRQPLCQRPFRWLAELCGWPAAGHRCPCRCMAGGGDRSRRLRRVRGLEKEEKINQNFNIDDKSDMESLLKYVTDDVIKLPLEQKRQMLIRDESFETIRSISNNAFEMAQEAYTSKSDNIDETKVDEMQKKLNELLKSVKAFNKQQAIWLVSEGILDLNFVKNPKTDIMSIRLGRCLQSK